MKRRQQKLLLVNNCYPTVKYPQASTYIVSIEESLKKTGLQVSRLVIPRQSFKRLFKFFQYLHFCLKVMIANFSKYDFVYVNHFTYVFFPVVLKILWKRNVIIHWHGEDLLGDTIRERFTRYLMKFTNKRSFIHIVPSRYFKGLILRNMDIDPGLVYVSPSGGVDTGMFSARFRRGATDSVIRI